MSKCACPCLINIREMPAHQVHKCQIPMVPYHVTYVSAVQIPINSCIDYGMH